MRRKLIKQDAFDQIQANSVTNSGRELNEAQQVLARAMDKSQLTLHCFNESTAVFETPEKTYIHTGYSIKEGKLTFNNIEELVIDETSRKEKRKSQLADMLESILNNEAEKAKSFFKNYLENVRWNDNKGKNNKKIQESAKSKIMEAVASKIGQNAKSAYVIAQNVLEYIEIMKNGPIVAEAVSKKDDKGNITNLQIPTSESRNQSRLLKNNWRAVNLENYNNRHSVPALVNNEDFVKAIANLKSMNAFSDHDSLVESLNYIVQKYPQVLFVTLPELSQLLGEALQMANVANYDDQTCEFMAEGILRHAHENYKEKVKQIMQLAGAANEDDQFENFQNVINNFYPKLDEQFGLEKQVFNDLYEASQMIHKQAAKQGNDQLKRESAAYVNELADILNGNIKPTLEVAEDTANWISKLIESNVQGAGAWNVSNKPHISVNGDHPQMSKNASVPAIASTHNGDWDDEAPAAGDGAMGKNAKEMRNDSWGQEGGSDVFPKLNNPYVPKSADFSMKGDTGVDKSGNALGDFKNNDVWPNMKNPYVPKDGEFKMDDKDSVVNQ